MGNLIHQGGPFFVAVLAMGVLGTIGLLIGAILAITANKTGKAEGPARIVAIILILSVPLPFLIGAMGTMQGEAMTMEAVAHASPETQATLMAAGRSISGIPQIFGLCTSMACLLPAALICVMVAGKRESWQSALADDPS